MCSPYRDTKRALFSIRFRDVDASDWGRVKALLSKFLLYFPYESNVCFWGIEHLLRHTVNSCCLGSLIGKDETQCFVYPLFLADKPVEMVEFVRRIVLCLDGEASLGFDDIGHTF